MVVKRNVVGFQGVPWPGLEFLERIEDAIDATAAGCMAPDRSVPMTVQEWEAVEGWAAARVRIAKELRVGPGRADIPVARMQEHFPGVAGEYGFAKLHGLEYDSTICLRRREDWKAPDFGCVEVKTVTEPGRRLQLNTSELRDARKQVYALMLVMPTRIGLVGWATRDEIKAYGYSPPRAALRETSKPVLWVEPHELRIDPVPASAIEAPDPARWKPSVGICQRSGPPGRAKEDQDGDSAASIATAADHGQRKGGPRNPVRASKTPVAEQTGVLAAQDGLLDGLPDPDFG